MYMSVSVYATQYFTVLAKVNAVKHYQQGGWVGCNYVTLCSGLFHVIQENLIIRTVNNFMQLYLTESLANTRLVNVQRIFSVCMSFCSTLVMRSMSISLAEGKEKEKTKRTCLIQFSTQLHINDLF